VIRSRVRRRQVRWTTAFWAVLIFVAAALVAAGQEPNSVYQKAGKDFQEGRVADAESALKSVLRGHPRDLSALSLMAVILDSERNYSEAEEFYRSALQIAPRSSAILNNLGNHYLATDNLKKAKESFWRVVTIDPHHVNANLQLADMSVQRKDGAGALAYLNHLPTTDQSEPVAQMLKAQALILMGSCKPAIHVLSALEEKTEKGSQFSFSVGLGYAKCQFYDRAEKSFSEALRADPTNFDVLYNLGLAARRAGHLERAQEVFEVALRSKPEDTDILYADGDLLLATKDFLAATVVLYRAARLAPARADVLLLLAHATEELRYYEETASTYEKYLKLRPGDEIARRERGFSLIRAGRFRDGIPEVQQFVRSHPKDVRGLYELAIGEISDSPVKALAHLDEALKLDPTMSQARYARAVLNYQEDRLDQSLNDFLAVRKIDPNSPRLMDWQAQIYLRHDQAQEAATLLRQAVELAPQDPAILIHYSKALRKLGRTAELSAVLAEFKKAAAEDSQRHARKGLFDFLDLFPAQQDARYLQSLQSAVDANPNDVALKARLAETLLDHGETQRAEGAFQQVLVAGTDAAILADCGRALLQREEYGLAAEFLQKLPNPGLELAIAVFHSISAEGGLAQLDEIPVDQRSGDYFLLRAEILDSMGKTGEAADSLNRGIREAPRRADMYFQATEFLIKHHQRQQAAALLESATRLLPDSADLWMARAIVLELLKRSDETLKVLAQIQSRWPEWDLPYLVNGIILQNELKPAEAKQMLDLAIALGTREADAYYYEALAITEMTPNNLEEAHKAIFQALALNPEDAAIRALAGKVLLDQGDYKAAVEQLLTAVQLQPTLVRAHYLLRTAYRNLGEGDKAAEELNQIERITQGNFEPDQVTSSMERLLFTVRAPAASAAAE